MATFPALNPTSRTYIPGQPPATALTTLNGDDLSVRHNNASTGNILRMSFNPIERSDQLAIISHYNIHGRFIPFDLEQLTLVASNISLPANYQWIYAGSPSIEETCSIISITVEIELIPPYII